MLDLIGVVVDGGCAGSAGIQDKPVTDGVINKCVGIATDSTAALGGQLIGLVVDPGDSYAAGQSGTDSVTDIVVSVIKRTDC